MHACSVRALVSLWVNFKVCLIVLSGGVLLLKHVPGLQVINPVNWLFPCLLVGPNLGSTVERPVCLLVFFGSKKTKTNARDKSEWRKKFIICVCERVSAKRWVEREIMNSCLHALGLRYFGVGRSCRRGCRRRWQWLRWQGLVLQPFDEQEPSIGWQCRGQHFQIGGCLQWRWWSLRFALTLALLIGTPANQTKWHPLGPWTYCVECGGEQCLLVSAAIVEHQILVGHLVDKFVICSCYYSLIIMQKKNNNNPCSPCGGLTWDPRPVEVLLLEELVGNDVVECVRIQWDALRFGYTN